MRLFLFFILAFILIGWLLNRIINPKRNKKPLIIEDLKQKAKAKFIDGLYIANIVPSNKQLILPLEELNQHLYVNATTGGGKTTLFLRIIRESIRYKMPIIMIDGKGSPDLIDKLKQIAKQSGRVFRCFSFIKHDGVSCYDFLGIGTKDELRNKLLNLLASKENEFFYERLVVFISRLLDLLDKAQKLDIIKNKIDLAYIYRLVSNDNKLIELASLLEDEVAKNYFLAMEKEREKPQERLLNILTPIMLSEYGELFDFVGKDNIINLYNSIINNEIILFLLDASSYNQDTARFGKIIIDDINATFSLLSRNNNTKKTLVIFDEFGAYASKSIATSIAIHRSNGLHAVIGSQSLETIEAGTDGKAIVSGIIANCNTQIILRTINQYDLELFSNKAGTRSSYNMTYQVKTEDDSHTGLGSMKIENRYKVDIESLRGLPVGIGYMYRVATNEVEKIQVIST